MRALDVPFLYDDSDIILRPRAYDQSVYLRDLFTNDYFDRFGERTYRPVATLSVFVDHALWGNDPRGHHAHNILLHALVSVTIFLVLIQLGAFPAAAFIGALIFASHPVRTEAVALASNREELLCALFFFISFALYLRKGTASKVFSLVSFILAIFSKEMAASLPIVIVAHDAYRYHDKGLFRTIRKKAVGYVPYFFIAALPLLLKFFVFENPEGAATLPGDTIGESFLIMCDVFLRYVQLTLAPVRLCMDYVFNSSHGIAPAAGLFFFVALMVILVRAGRTAGFALAFFLITLLPVSNIIPFGETLAERYLYIPAFALSIAVAMIPGRALPLRATVPFFLVIVILFSIGTYKRLGVWQSDLSLWSDTTICAPNSDEAWLNLGNSYLRRGQAAEALENYNRVSSCASDYKKGKYFYNKGLALLMTGDPENALGSFLSAIDHNPDFIEAYYQSANLLGASGKKDDGLKMLNRSIELAPNNPQSHYIAALYIMKNFEGDESSAKAVVLLDKAVRIDPSSAVYLGALGQALLMSGRPREAERRLMQSINIDPNLRGSYELLKNIYLMSGRKDRASEIEALLQGLGRSASDD